MSKPQTLKTNVEETKLIKMAQTALAYNQPMRKERYERMPERNPQQHPRQQLKVLPGKGVDSQANAALAPTWHKLFALAIVAVFVVGVVWIARVSLTEATMSMMAASEQTSQAIAAERLAASQLEVEYSKATNPLTVQGAAEDQLGMSEDDQIEYLRVTNTE